MHVKFLDELPDAVYSTAGWDSWSKLQEGDDPTQLKLSPGGDGGGVLGAHETFGDASAPQVATPPHPPARYRLLPPPYPTPHPIS